MSKTKIFFAVIVFIVIAGGVGTYLESERDKEAIKLGYESAEQMDELTERGFKSLAEYKKVKEFSPEHFFKNCKEASSDDYQKNCRGQRVSWTGVIAEVGTSDGANIRLRSEDDMPPGNLFSIDSKSLDELVSKGDVGKLVEFDGKVGAKNWFTPDIDEVTFAKVEEDGAYEARVAAEAKAASKAKELAAAAAKSKQLAEEKELRDMYQYMPSVKWTKIYTETNYRESKGGVFVEDNWFGSDRVYTTQDRVSVSETVYFLDQSSITNVSENTREAFFRTDDYSNLDTVEKTRFNCASKTFLVRSEWFVGQVEG